MTTTTTKSAAAMFEHRSVVEVNNSMQVPARRQAMDVERRAVQTIAPTKALVHLRSRRHADRHRRHARATLAHRAAPVDDVAFSQQNCTVDTTNRPIRILQTLQNPANPMASQRATGISKTTTKQRNQILIKKIDREMLVGSL